ncbi:unnamed protein product [Leptidea sinapis]|uniref:Uncharacterized protein n=1 Tax=Leptidea sinapis TaxID=189913 RepID=A0A5E4QLM7_9NEOP|nr:unnamed protein product [Leptidea sinapis]
MSARWLETIFISDVVYSVFDTIWGNKFVETLSSDSLEVVDCLQTTVFLSKDSVLSLIEVVVAVGEDICFLTDDAEVVIVLVGLVLVGDNLGYNWSYWGWRWWHVWLVDGLEGGVDVDWGKSGYWSGGGNWSSGCNWGSCGLWSGVSHWGKSDLLGYVSASWLEAIFVSGVVYSVFDAIGGNKFVETSGSDSLEVVDLLQATVFLSKDSILSLIEIGAKVDTGAAGVTGADVVTGTNVVTGEALVAGAKVATGAALVTGSNVVTGAKVDDETKEVTGTGVVTGTAVVTGAKVVGMGANVEGQENQ